MYADPLRVRQVIRNLLSNAIRYGGQEVTVEVSEQDGWSSVVVIDDGRGIPEADRERVFEPYQRSEARQGLTASIGVGLTVARRLARLMGGELSYEYRDSRSRFMFTLPMQPDVAVSE